MTLYREIKEKEMEETNKQQRDQEIADTIKNRPRKTPFFLKESYQAGSDAYGAGLKHSDNPYDETAQREDWENWRRGYVFAFNKANPDRVEFPLSSDPARAVFENAKSWAEAAANRHWQGEQ